MTTMVDIHMIDSAPRENAMTETYKQLLMGALLYTLLYGEIEEGDIKVAQQLQEEYFLDLPPWVHTLAGSINPETRDAAIELAKQDLILELQGADDD